MKIKIVKDNLVNGDYFMTDIKSVVILDDFDNVISLALDTDQNIILSDCTDPSFPETVKKLGINYNTKIIKAN